MKTEREEFDKIIATFSWQPIVASPNGDSL
jgi:hypothetical protein